MPASRVLALTGSCNLRDFGGYATADGRRVREGRLFRSGLLNRLAPDAIDALRALPLRTVCDLRRTAERELHPNPDFGDGVRTYAWDTAVESSPIRDRRFAESPSAEAARGAMVDMYGRIPFVLRERLAGVFHALGQTEQGAVVVHCSAGKDRTGVAVALVLEALGVPRTTVVEDYVLTNLAVDLRQQLLGDEATGVGLAATADPIRALPPVAREAVIDAHPSYILAALEAVDARHGSVERYLLDELRVEPSLLAAARHRLLADD